MVKFGLGSRSVDEASEMFKLGLHEEAMNDETISPWRINLVLNVRTRRIDITSVDPNLRGQFKERLGHF